MDQKNKKYYDSTERNMVQSEFNQNIEDETFLLKPKYFSKKKSEIELKDSLKPSDFSIPIKTNKFNKSKKEKIIYGNHYGPGKGCGNLDINNNIRLGKSSRENNDIFNKNRESSINNRVDLITKNYQDPNHIILPFARGGEITRKTNNYLDEEPKEFEFKY